MSKYTEQQFIYINLSLFCQSTRQGSDILTDHILFQVHVMPTTCISSIQKKQY